MNNEFDNVDVVKNTTSYNGFYHIYYDKFNGRKIFKIKNFCREVSGILCINVKNAVDMKLFIDGVLVSKINGDTFNIVNVVWQENSDFAIEGKSDTLKISMTNINFNMDKNMDLMPMKNKIIMDCGGEFQLFSYDNYESVINNSLQLLKNFENIYSYSVVNLNNEHLLCFLYKVDNSAYLCTEKDNYTSSIFVGDYYKDVCVVPKSDGGFYIVYIKDNRLYSKIVSNNLEIGEEILINFNIKYRPIKLEHLAYNNLSCSVFCVRWENNVTSIFSLNKNKFLLNTSVKSPSSTVYVLQDFVYVVARYKTKVVVYKYIITKNDDEILLTFDNCYSLNNANDCYLIDDKFIFKKDGVYTIIDQSII